MVRRRIWLALGVVLVAVFATSLFLGLVPYCKMNDAECIEDAINSRDECIPSIRKIEWGNGTDYFVLRIEIKRVGDECLITETIEKIVGDTEIAPDLLGQEISYNKTVSENESIFNEESIFDSMGGGSEGGAGSPEDKTKVFICGPEDYYCREQSTNYIQNCINAVITDTEHKWYPVAYWTKYITVNRESNSCRLYFEIIDATELPGDIPPGIIGRTMSCTIPIDIVPFQDLEEDWCEGPLFDYMKNL